MAKSEAGKGGDQVTLKIPRPLYDRLKALIADSGFHSVTEFAVYVLRDLASHHPTGPVAAAPAPLAAAPIAVGAPEEDQEPLSPEEIEMIRRRLSSLGYL